MHRLLVLRHAKTERTNPGGDHARVLVARGRDDAVIMGQFLARENLAPDHALASDAARTRETFGLIVQGLGAKPAAEFNSALYLAAPAAILDAIRAAPGTAQTLLIIGHNPGLHQLAFELGQHGPRRLTEALVAKFPTCALAVIESDALSWQTIHPASCRLARYMTAKSLRENTLAEAEDDC